HCVEYFLDVTVFREKPARSSTDTINDEIIRVVHAEHDDSDRRVAGGDNAQGFAPTHDRHFQVHQNDINHFSAELVEEQRAIGYVRYNGYVLFIVEQVHDALSD